VNPGAQLQNCFDLKILSSGEVSGTASVEVKFVDIRKNTSGEAAHWPDTDAEARKRGSKRIRYPGSPRRNDECQPLVGLLTSGAANALSIRWEYGRKIKTQRN